MTCVFGMLPNVIWASILARVLDRAVKKIGDFDVDGFKKWATSNSKGMPIRLGFPAKDCVSRILPKGACGVGPSKPMHDDHNGVISLSCWTSVTESNAPTDLVFLVDGKEVIIRATALRWVLFMGYIPHETRAADVRNPANQPRLHHSSFVKPEVEYLATHVLSNLPCESGDCDWSMDFVNSKNGLRDNFGKVEYLATHVLSNLPCESGDCDWSMDFVNSKNGLRDNFGIIPITRRQK